MKIVNCNCYKDESIHLYDLVKIGRAFHLTIQPDAKIGKAIPVYVEHPVMTENNYCPKCGTKHGEIDDG
jgi:hypothetical protein